MKARIIAYYLPQYHPIPENDKYWGKGFTEWTNVVQARPLFRGHKQPHIPADLGFYDLRLPEVREEQAQLARKAGIEGFMYWHYWFGGGKELLERPFNEVVNSGKPDFPFCLGWANHDWSTKSWTVNKNFKNVMIAKQTYPGDEDIILHFNTYLKAFRDPRYIKVDGKLLFVVFKPLDVPNMKRHIELWQQLAKENGLDGFHFVGVYGSRGTSKQQLLDMGFDAGNLSELWKAEVDSIGNLWLRRLRNLLRKRGLIVDKFKYASIIKHMGCEEDYEEDTYPIILPCYDRTPRSKREATIYYGSTPEIFKKHVRKMLKYVENKKQEHKIIFLKSWNEWGEGNYMEPDLEYGDAYLKALQEAVK